MHPESEKQNSTQIASRRTVLSGIGLAAAAVAVPSVSRAAASFGTQGFWNKEYVAKKGDVKLQLYRRRTSEPKAGEKPLPTVVMVHGSSLGAMSSWDLTVPGAGEYN